MTIPTNPPDGEFISPKVERAEEQHPTEQTEAQDDGLAYQYQCKNCDCLWWRWPADSNDPGSTWSLWSNDGPCEKCDNSPDFLLWVKRTDDDFKLKALKALTVENATLRSQLEAASAESERLQLMVNDLHSGMYINCVYCGHRYGPSPDTPVSMADVLKAHVEQCPQHPMSALRTEVLAWRAAWAQFRRRYPYQRPPELMAAAALGDKSPS